MKYRVTHPVTVDAGARLILSKDQAAVRANNLKSLGNGQYEATAPLQFKAGEELSITSDISKHIKQSLQATKQKAEPATATA